MSMVSINMSYQIFTINMIVQNAVIPYIGSQALSSLRGDRCEGNCLLLSVAKGHSTVEPMTALSEHAMELRAGPHTKPGMRWNSLDAAVRKRYVQIND